MTVPPPPAVPGELIEKAAKALHDRWCLVPGCGCPLRARRALAAVYGDIAEAARRDALTAAVEAIKGEAEREKDSPPRGWDEHTYWDGVTAGKLRAAHIAADLIDGTAPSRTLRATHADPTPVPRIPGTDGAQERSEGRGDD